jgi:integrase
MANSTSLWQHPNGFFYILYGPRLQRRLSTRTTDRRQAEQFHARFTLGTESPVVAQPCIGDILDGYEKDAQQRVRSKESLRYAVVALKARLGALPPADLLPPVIRKYAKDRGSSSGTIIRELGVLRAALGWAVANKWIAEKPVISAPVATPKPRNRWITKDEAKRLLAACEAPHLKLFVMLGLTTAARMSAILELKWDQVDLTRRVIDYGEGHGNKRRAVAPINDQLYPMLTAAKALSGSEYVVSYHGKPLATVKKGFRLACERAGIEGVTPHILRHTAATWMALDGVPLAEIARMLGDEERTVERVYAKHTPGYLKRAAGALQFDTAAE